MHYRDVFLMGSLRVRSMQTYQSGEFSFGAPALRSPPGGGKSNSRAENSFAGRRRFWRAGARKVTSQVWVSFGPNFFAVPFFGPLARKIFMPNNNDLLVCSLDALIWRVCTLFFSESTLFLQCNVINSYCITPLRRVPQDLLSISHRISLLLSWAYFNFPTAAYRENVFLTSYMKSVSPF